MTDFRPVSEVQADAELVRRLQRGDDDAVRQLFDRFGAPVFAVALGSLGDGADTGSVANSAHGSDASDLDDAGRSEFAARVTRHVFLQAWRNAPDFEPGRDFAPWLRMLTRRAAQAGRPEAGLPPGPPAAPTSVTAEVSVDGVQPEGADADRLDADVIWTVRAALDSLESGDRQVLRQRVAGAGSHDAIASELSISADDVARRSERAMRRLANRVAHVTDRDLDELLSDSIIWVDVPDDLAERVVAAVRSEARLDGSEPVVDAAGQGRTIGGRRIAAWVRPGLLGALAVVGFLFVGVIALSALSDVETVEPTTYQLVSTGAIAGVGGEISVAPSQSGLQIELVAPALPASVGETFYRAVVLRDDDVLVDAGTFRGGAAVTLSVAVDVERAVLFAVVLDPGAGSSSDPDTQSGTAGDVARLDDLDVILRVQLRR